MAEFDPAYLLSWRDNIRISERLHRQAGYLTYLCPSPQSKSALNVTLYIIMIYVQAMDHSQNFSCPLESHMQLEGTTEIHASQAIICYCNCYIIIFCCCCCSCLSGFLTAILQTHARERNVPVDSLGFSYRVLKEKWTPDEMLHNESNVDFKRVAFQVR